MQQQRVSFVKRLIAITTIALLSGIPIAGAGSYASGGRWAIAVWFKIEHGHYVMYWVDVFQGAGSTPTAGSFATVARVDCIDKGERVNCPRPRERDEIPVTDFTMDPMLESAVLDTTIDGVHHHIEWTPDLNNGGGETHSYGDINEHGAFENAGDHMTARIKGRVFGKKVGPRSWWLPTYGRSVGGSIEPEERWPGTVRFHGRTIEVTR